MAQTSESHPIRVSWVVHAGESGGGKLGLCFCPGKRMKNSRLKRAGHEEGGQGIDRDMGTDLARLKGAFGCGCVVSLLSVAELRSIGVTGDYAAAVARCGMSFVSFPIIEGAASAAGGGHTDAAHTAEVLVRPIAARLRAGENVIMHCRGGVGRAGMLAACTLLELGVCRGPARAVGLVRARRCKSAVETRRQEDFVKAYRKLLGDGSEGGEGAAQDDGIAGGGGVGGWRVSPEQLRAFYDRHDQSKIAKVPAILERFSAAQIRARLLQKYGEACGEACDSESDTIAREEEAADQGEGEAFHGNVKVKGKGEEGKEGAWSRLTADLADCHDKVD